MWAAVLPPHPLISNGEAHLSLVDLIRKNCLDLGPGLHREDGVVDAIVPQHTLHVPGDFDTLLRQSTAIRMQPATCALLPTIHISFEVCRCVALHAWTLWYCSNISCSGVFAGTAIPIKFTGEAGHFAESKLPVAFANNSSCTEFQATYLVSSSHPKIRPL